VSAQVKGSHKGCPTEKIIMKLKINGTETDIQDDLTVSKFLESLKIDSARVAVEVNMNIVKKCHYLEYVLKDGDAVEIVNFVGGG
jgi:sulfur carrier protein